MQSYLQNFSARLLIEYSPLNSIQWAIAQTPKPSCATFVQSHSVQQTSKRDSPLEGLLAISLFGFIALGLIGFDTPLALCRGDSSFNESTYLKLLAVP